MPNAGTKIPIDFVEDSIILVLQKVAVSINIPLEKQLENKKFIINSSNQ